MARRGNVQRIALLALSMGTALCFSAHAATPWWRSTNGSLSWVPVGPPPSVIDEFLALYSGYSALPSPKLWTFDEWIVRHGVIDPLRRRWMLTLYLWMERRAEA